MLLVWFQDLKWTWSKYLKRCLQTKHWSIWTLDRIRDSGKFSEPTYNVLEACYFLTFGFVHITLEKSENWVFTLKTHQMFSVHTTCRRNLKALFALWKRTKCFLSTLRRRNLKSQLVITSHFGFVFDENSGREITWLPWRHRFWKAPFS